MPVEEYLGVSEREHGEGKWGKRERERKENSTTADAETAIIVRRRDRPVSVQLR